MTAALVAATVVITVAVFGAIVGIASVRKHSLTLEHEYRMAPLTNDAAVIEADQSVSDKAHEVEAKRAEALTAAIKGLDSYRIKSADDPLAQAAIRALDKILERMS